MELFCFGYIFSVMRLIPYLVNIKTYEKVGLKFMLYSLCVDIYYYIININVTLINKIDRFITAGMQELINVVCSYACLFYVWHLLMCIILRLENPDRNISRMEGRTYHLIVIGIVLAYYFTGIV